MLAILGKSNRSPIGRQCDRKRSADHKSEIARTSASYRSAFGGTGEDIEDAIGILSLLRERSAEDRQEFFTAGSRADVPGRKRPKELHRVLMRAV